MISDIKQDIQSIEDFIMLAVQNPCNLHNAYFVNEPGSGKYQTMVKTVSDISQRIGKEIEIIEFRLVQMELGDIEGISLPVIDNNNMHMVVSTPKWVPTGDDKCYLFYIDELENCDIFVNRAVLNLIKTYTTKNGTKLPITSMFVVPLYQKPNKHLISSVLRKVIFN